MLGARLPPLGIMAAHGVQVKKGRNPYFSPLSAPAWMLLFVTAALVAPFLSISEYDRGMGCAHFMRTMLGQMLQSLGILINQPVSPTIWRANVTAKLLSVHVIPGVMFIALVYTSALHSEFTLKKSNHLKINYIHELAGSNVYLVFNDAHCQMVSQYRGTEPKGEIYSGIKLCTKIIGQLIDQCTFLEQSQIVLKGVALHRVPANDTPAWEVFQHVVGLGRNISLICTNEISQVLNAAKFNGTIDKIAFLTSQQDSPKVWNILRQTTEVDFGYKLDGEESYYRPRTGVRLPSYLRPNQQWVRRNLRALFRSGIHDLWSRWERRSAYVKVKRMGEKWTRAQSRPRPISLENSWFQSVVVHGLLPAFLVSCLVAVAENILNKLQH